MRRFANAMIVLVAACTDVATITPNVCGNHVLEPAVGEDCDQPGGACNAQCRIVCDPAMRGTTCSSAIDGTCCPGGFTCGLDAVCHAPTGKLAAASEEALPLTGFTIADLDDDGRQDLLGASSTSVFVRHGAASTPLAAGEILSSPFSSGLGNFGDFTGDGKPDVLVPIQGGIAAFETSSGTAQAVVFPAPGLISSTPGEAYLRGALVSGSSVVHLDDETAGLQLARDTGTHWAPCGLSIDRSAVRGRALHVYSDGTKVRVPMLLASTTTGIVLCVETADNSGSQQIPVNAGGTSLDGEMFFAHLDAGSAGCPDLVVPTTTRITKIESTTLLPPAGGSVSGACTNDGAKMIDARTVDPMTLASTPIGLSMASLPLATTPAKTALVTSTGIYTVDAQPKTSGAAGAGSSTMQLVDPSKDFVAAGVAVGDLVYTHGAAAVQIQVGVVQTVATTTLTFAQPLTLSIQTGVGYTVNRAAVRVAAATRNWRYVATGDLDGNGTTDFVTAGDGTDIEVFLQEPSTNTTPRFHQTRIGTDSTAQVIALGDYDGDGFGDVAIDVPDSTGTSSTISVAFATSPTAFATPAPVASLVGLAFMVTASLQDPTLPPGFDQSQDLITGYGSTQTTPGTAKIAYLYGSGARQLSAPWIKPVGATLPPYTIGWALVAGKFQAGAPPSVISFFSDGLYSGANTEIDLLSYSGDTFGIAAAAGAVPTCLPDSSTLCPSQARYVVWHRSSGDLVLALRGSSEKLLAQPSVCAGYYATGAQVSGNALALSCDALLGAGNSAAQWLWGVTHAHAVGTSDDTSTLMWTAKQIGLLGNSHGVLWKMTANPAPQLAVVFDPQDELSAAGLGTAACTDIASAELGARSVGGATYGSQAPEYVLACKIDVGDELPMRIFGRYEADDGTSPPYYELLTDVGTNVGVQMRSGDFDGDGLDDVAYTAVGKTGTLLDVQVQCDTHSSACAPRGGN